MFYPWLLQMASMADSILEFKPTNVIYSLHWRLETFSSSVAFINVQSCSMQLSTKLQTQAALKVIMGCLVMPVGHGHNSGLTSYFINIQIIQRTEEFGFSISQYQKLTRYWYVVQKKPKIFKYVGTNAHVFFSYTAI